MHFEVIFKVDGRDMYIVNSSILADSVGIKTLDWIRHELKNPNLSLGSVTTEISKVVATDKAIEISEEMARESGLFENKSTVIVCCPPLFLNKYLQKRILEVPKVRLQNYRVEVSWVLDEEAIISDWKKQGFPVRFDGGGE